MKTVANEIAADLHDDGEPGSYRYWVYRAIQGWESNGKHRDGNVKTGNDNEFATERAATKAAEELRQLIDVTYPIVF